MIRTHTKHANCVLDFGAGDGELCKQIANQQKDVKIFCYEPTPSLLNEAKQNLSQNHETTITFLDQLDNQLNNKIDVVCCLEVFEHLPPAETQQAIRDIRNLLTPNGHAVIGVPVEVGFPALYKGLFRMARR